MLSDRLDASEAVFCHGSAQFANAHTVRLRPAAEHGELLLHAKKILIATGSAPVLPAVFPFGSAGVYDSDTILQLNALPQKLAVIGAGVIGSEYASTFAALGTRVCVIDGRGALLPFLDAEVCSALAAAMERSGITFRMEERVVTCTVGTDANIGLQLSSGEWLTVDTVLVAAGRRSNTDRLNLAAAGTTANARGLIRVDEHFRTEVPHIYAAGDVIGFPALASTSMQQGRLAVMHAFGSDVSSAAFHLLPTGIYTIPEFGMVGDTEQSLKQKGTDYVIGLGPYQANARGRIIGDQSGFLKLLFQRDNMKLIGVHAIGERATELVHIGLLAVLTNSTAHLLSETCFNMPTLGELYKLASLNAITLARTGRPLVDVPSISGAIAR